ncbi:MAG: hypothetical protein Q9227_008246 [Pyrenula ochraceoflavens]
MSYGSNPHKRMEIKSRQVYGKAEEKRNSNENQQWLLYYISRPLLGFFHSESIPQAVVPRTILGDDAANEPLKPEGNPSAVKKDIRVFGDVLIKFPMIARQMQIGLERLFKEFGKELGKPLPPPPSSSTDSEEEYIDDADDQSFFQSHMTNGHITMPSATAEFFEDEEDHMRRALETAVTAAIDLFQLVDKQQLSLLGATTDLTGPVVEKLIERYVADQVFETLLFPRLCNFRKIEDQELDRRIYHMENIDVSQVGISIEEGLNGRENLNRRLKKGVETFRRMGVAGTPQEMLEILLETEKAVTDEPDSTTRQTTINGDLEKPASVLTINADILVSLLLIVVIRSQVRHLLARLSCMQKFIFVVDVESGETGYALSTFEAVISYLSDDSAGLRHASLRNKRLWQATKHGNVDEMRAILEPNEDSLVNDNGINVATRHRKSSTERQTLQETVLPSNSSSFGENTLESGSEQAIVDDSNLSHVFPFQSWTVEPPTPVPGPPKSAKKVSMDMRSLSGSSAISFKSRTTTMGSTTSGIEGDTSIESLSRTRDPLGNSIPMMAVEARQPKSLHYLFSLTQFYSPQSLMEDVSSEGTTLLSTAVQLADLEVINAILEYMSQKISGPEELSYLSKADSRGRTVAHYLFNTPFLLSRWGTKLPWTQKDKIGQTPLFALCRSYDHPEYSTMVNEALAIAKDSQNDGQPLRLDDHIDAKGNTLLHIVNDPKIIKLILRVCDVDPNAVNDRKFTPLMLASKYGRVDMVGVLFGDARVDISLRELRGMTAVELAKDDEVRNRIDDLTLFARGPSGPGPSPDSNGRLTGVVRSFFVEDASIRFIIKSGVPTSSERTDSTSYTMTTCRRSQLEFELLSTWLALEHPASYIPNISNLRSPFQIQSKPSRSVLHDMQVQLDWFLRTMLGHPTFGKHEMLWEFFLVPDMHTAIMGQRAMLKSKILSETITEEYEAATDVRDIEQFITHSKDMVRSVNAATRSLIRRGHSLRHAHDDLSDSLSMASTALATLGKPTDILPPSYLNTFSRYAALMNTSSDSYPLHSFIQSLTAFHGTILAMLSSLGRPSVLITQLTTAQRNLSRNRSNLTSQSLPRKFNFPGLEESRVRNLKETEKKIADGEREIESVGKELKWTQEVVAGELAGWTDWREQQGKQIIQRFARGMVIKERERFRSIQRCLQSLKQGESTSVAKQKENLK